jgi:hypothetical protein
MTDTEALHGPPKALAALHAERAMSKREARRRQAAEAEAEMLRTRLDKVAWQAAMWRANVPHTPGNMLVGPMLDPGTYDDPQAVRAAVGAVTAELLGAHVGATGRTLTEVAEQLA